MTEDSVEINLTGDANAINDIVAGKTLKDSPLEGAESTNLDASECCVQTPTAEGSSHNDNTQADVVDEYSYTRRDDFTSELFKLSITNLPKRFGFKVLCNVTNM